MAAVFLASQRFARRANSGSFSCCLLVAVMLLGSCFRLPPFTTGLRCVNPTSSSLHFARRTTPFMCSSGSLKETHTHQKSRWGGEEQRSDVNIALLVAYDGTRFEGFTEPGTKRSVEKWLRTNLEQVHSKEPQSLRAASRTDRGVHARGQVVCYRPSKPPFNGDLTKMKFALNRMLPDDLRVLSVALSPSPDFHPTFDATSKQYTYTIDTSRIQDPMKRLFSWHYPPGHDGGGNLDVPAMEMAAKTFIGQHDFRVFKSAFRGNERSRENQISTVCNISSLRIWQADSSTIKVTISGDRFLYKMVRNMVGHLVQVGKHQVDATMTADMLLKKGEEAGGKHQKDQNTVVKVNDGKQDNDNSSNYENWIYQGGPDGKESIHSMGIFSNSPSPSGILCAPAHGLVLDSVSYQQELFSVEDGS